MMEQNNRAETLRERAAELLQKNPEAYQAGNLKDLSELAQELAVYQIELEMQNEELQHAQVLQQETQDQLTALFEYAPVGYVLLNAAGIIQRANQTWYRMLNQPEADLRGKPFAGTLVEEDVSIFLGRFRAFFSDPSEKQVVVRMQRRSLDPFFARIEASSLAVKGLRNHTEKNEQETLLVAISDISDLQESNRKVEEQNAALLQANEREKRLNAILGAIRNVNQLITKEKDQDKLLQGTCQTLTGGLSYHNAWVALLDETGQVTKAAGSGFNDGFRALQDQLYHGDFPLCMRNALAGSEVVVVHNPESHCQDCPIALDYDHHANLARRLEFNGRTLGILAVSVPAPFADSEEEQGLFMEASDDLAFALHKIDIMQKLDESRRRHREIFEGSRDGFVMVNPEGQILDANQAYCDMLGYSLEELKELENFYQVTPAKWRDWEAEEIWKNRLLQDGESGIYEKEYIRKDGTIFPVELQSYSVTDQRGKIQYLWGSVRNITYRKAAEMALEESEEKYRLLAETTRDIILLHDMQGRIVYVNQAGLDMAGFTMSEALGKPISSFIPPEQLAEISARKKQRQQGASQVFRYETTFIDKRGKTIPVEVHSSPIIRQGNTAEVLIVARDITERKQAEEEIRQHLSRLAAMVEILQDRSAEEQVFLNHALEKALDLTGSQFGFVHLFDEDRSEFVLNLWSQAVLQDCTVADPQTFYKLEDTGIWGEAVRQRQPIVLNDFQAEHLLKKGYPEGHVHLDRFLTVPVLIQDRIVAVVGVANKPQDYDETDVLQMTLLMDSVWNSVENRRAQQTLQARERYLSTILETTVEGFWVVDAEGHLVDVNPAYCEMSGYSREELLHLSIADLDAEEQPEQTAARIQRIMDRGSEIFETRHRRKDGSQWNVEISITWMDDNGGRFICFCRDLTERTERDERIALLGHMLDDAPASITIHSMTGEFVFANRHTLDLHGYDSAEEFLAVNLHDLDIPESEKLLEERVSRITAEGEARFETAHYRRDGTTVPLEVQAKAIEWNGEPSVLSIASDISERKRMERENDLLSGLIKRSQDFIGVADENQIPIYVNPAGREMVGLDGEDVRKFSITDFFCEEDLPYVSEIILPELLENGRWAGEFRFKHFKTGDPLHVLYDVFLTDDPDTGEGVNIGTVTRDITERKQAEQKLIESEERFRSYIENSPVGVYITDEAGKLMDVNHAACIDTGYSQEELLQMSVMDLYPPERQDEAFSQFQAILTDHTLMTEMPFLRKDGSQGSWSMSAILLPNGQVMGFAADISEKKSLEDQLLQAQKMEIIGRLAGGVAHDFNNMLSVILGHLEMALEELDPSDEVCSNLKEAQKSAERSAALTAQLLAFARKQTVAPVELDLNRTIADMLKMLESLIGEDIDLLWKPGEGLGKVRIDPTQINQMLANLCVNARDAISGTGKVTIETGSACFDEAYCASHIGFLPGSYVMMAVSDDGCGMDKDVFDHLFEPFFTTKDVGQGTGLGLATVYGIVKQNNGFINAYSEPGEGTTFRIYLPQIETPLEQDVPPRAAVSSEPGEGTILLVEDEPAILKVTTIMLERMGYHVLPASSPDESIRLAENYSGRIDLLITDVIMPGMNGRDLANRLLSQHPGMKQLFMSGYTANTIAHHGVLDQGVDFIQKPFSVQALSTKVRDVLNRS